VSIEQNTIESLLIGLDSENIGLKSSSAYMIGELQLSQAIIPLMKMLRESKNEELRIVAALALYKIGTPMAIYAVKQASKFDDSERVSKHCASFYNDFSKNKIIDEDISMVAAKTALK
jgi:HEAT repeat protein